ncbi:MAG: sigma-E processing peptidase SpoIIGA [Firmicutes bacterium]|nr:sigma-E processing peptidase SpoIIGA [Bacillota bacterium]
MTVIYLDVLIGLNWIIDYFLLLAAAHLLSRKVRRWRIVLGAALGGAASAMVLIPDINGLLSFLMHTAAAALMVLITYEFQSVRLFFKTLLCFYAVSFSFSGIMYAVWYAAAPQGMIWRCGVVYFDISPLLLILLTVFCYLLLILLQKLVGRKEAPEKFFSVEITIGEQTAEFRAMLDTGNALVERMSGAPVIVAEYDAVQSLIPEELQKIYAAGEVERIDILERSGWEKRFRVIPFASVGAQSLLPAFFPDKITLEKGEVVRSCVAVCPQKLSSGLYHALVPSVLVETVQLQTKKKKRKTAAKHQRNQMQ